MPADLGEASGTPRPTLLERFVRSKPMRRFFDFPLVRRVLSPAHGDRAVHRFIRYSMVSGVAIVLSQAAILICTAAFHLSGILSNTIGAVVATPASYELNRKWAWGKRGKSHLWKEVVPFWGLTLVGYLGSTGTVQVADNLCKSHHVTGLDRAFSIMAASLLAYGVVWIGKFILFNKVIFVGSPTAGAPAFAPPPPTGPGGATTTVPSASERSLAAVPDPESVSGGP